MILNSPTTTERDYAAVEYLGRVLALDAVELGREMFVATSDLDGVGADAIVTRDLKEYEVGGGQIAIAQVETVGAGLDGRHDELMEAMERVRERNGYGLYALMVTDILAKDTDLYVSGDAGPLEAGVRARGAQRRDPAARRDEPQEAGRAEGARGSVKWVG